MAIKVVVWGGPGHDDYYKEFVMTGTSDKPNLPTSATPIPDKASAGSQAYTQDMEHVYLLGIDDVWREG